LGKESEQIDILLLTIRRRRKTLYTIACFDNYYVKEKDVAQHD